MKRVIILFLIWRCFLFIVAGASPVFINQFGARFPYYEERLVATKLPHFIWSFGNFDGVHYLGIAQDAYAAQYTQAFFPLYPILIRALSLITFGSLLLSALLISNLTFLASLLIFYKLIEKIFDSKIAFWSVVFLLAFPTSFYFGAVYTEGLFFLLIISAFYLAQMGKTWQASVIGALATATRLVGIFLVPSLVFKKSLKSILSLAIVPLGLILYVIFLKWQFNDPFYFLTSQQVFGQERLNSGVILLPQVIFRYLRILLTTSGLGFATALFELLATLLAFIVLTYALKIKKLKPQWLIFSLLAVIIPTLTGTLASMPRYILVAFPIYIVAASISSVKIKIVLVSLSVVALTVATALFAQGYWVA